MPSIYNLKPAFQKLLRPILKFLADCGVSPNQITVLAIFLSMLGGVFVWLAAAIPYFLLFIPIILLTRMALNALDGMLAREYNRSSQLGEILNEVGDIVSDTFLYLPFIAFAPTNLIALLFICLFVIFGIICEFTGVLAKAMINDRRYDGPMGKSDRAFTMSLFSLALFFWPQVIHYAPLLFGVINTLLLISCLNRLKAILTHTINSGSKLIE